MKWWSKNRHYYLTIFLNRETGKVLYVREGRKYETVKTLFDSLNQKQKDLIEAVTIDTRNLSSKAIKTYDPKALMVFDQLNLW